MWLEVAVRRVEGKGCVNLQKRLSIAVGLVNEPNIHHSYSHLRRFQSSANSGVVIKWVLDPSGTCEALSRPDHASHQFDSSVDRVGGLHSRRSARIPAPRQPSRRGGNGPLFACDGGARHRQLNASLRARSRSRIRHAGGAPALRRPAGVAVERQPASTWSST